MWRCLAVEVRDRFGDYGLVGAAFFETRDDALWVETVLMSCRALGRGVEHRSVARLGEIALARGLARVRIPFAPTPKNQPLLQFLRRDRRPCEATAGKRDRPSSSSTPATAAQLTYDPDPPRGRARAARTSRQTSPAAERPSAFRLDTEPVLGHRHGHPFSRADPGAHGRLDTASPAR